MLAQELIDLLARQYRDQPDDYVVSIGHWSEPRPHPDGRGGWVSYPDFYADIKLTAGELRAAANKRCDPIDEAALADELDVVEAVEAERERCAKIAERWGDRQVQMTDTARVPGASHDEKFAARGIADAIRNQD